MSIKVNIGPSTKTATSGPIYDDSPEHFVPSSPSSVSSSDGANGVNMAVIAPRSSFSTLDAFKGAYGRFARQMKIGVLLLRSFLLKPDEATKTQLLFGALEYADEGIEILFDEIRRFGLNENRIKIFNEIYGQRAAILNARFETTVDFNLLIECADRLIKTRSFEEFMLGHQLENAKQRFIPQYEASLARFVGVLSANFYRELLSGSDVDPTAIFMHLKIMASKSSLKSTREVAEKVLLDFARFMVAQGEFKSAAELIDFNKDVFVSSKAVDVYLQLLLEEFVKVYEEAMPKRIAQILDPSGNNEDAFETGKQSFVVISEVLMQTLRMAPAMRALAITPNAKLVEILKKNGFDGEAKTPSGQPTADAIIDIFRKYFSGAFEIELKLFATQAAADAHFKELYDSAVGKPTMLPGAVLFGIRQPDFKAPVRPFSGLLTTSIEHGVVLPREVLDGLTEAEALLRKEMEKVNLRARLRFERK